MPAAGGSSARYAVSHLKLPGTLSITATHLQWVPSAASAAASAALDVPLRAITGLSVSKPGAASAALLVVVAPGTPGIGGRPKAMLHFTPHANDADAAVRSRDSVKDQLSAVVAANREQDTAGSSTAAGAAAPAPAAASPSAVASTSATAPTAAGKKSVKPELELRYRVLMANPALAALHRDLVMSHALSDAEFWSHPTRTALLNAERAAAEQRRGRNARIADPKPRTDERGEMRVEVTPQLKRDLFEQYPVVRRAWEENVPSVMDEPSFWTRYFQSRLYHRLRTSARSAANEHIFKDDEILDRYLEKDEDDQIEPRRQHNPHDAFLDLGATAEDHQETGNAADFTMRAGSSRSALPLMRRFNEHSTSLLDDALGTQDEASRAKRRKIGIEQDYGGPAAAGHWEDIRMDDLGGEGEARGVPLDMRGRRGLFERRAGASEPGASDALSDETLRRALAADGSSELLAWQSALGDFKAQGTAGAMRVMLHSISTRAAARASTKTDLLPESVQKAVVAHHAAVNEFLRQYWAALAQQPARAARMLEGIARLRERGLEVEQEAEQAQPGAGRERVRTFLAPTVQAVTRAMSIAARSKAAGSSDAT